MGRVMPQPAGVRRFVIVALALSALAVAGLPVTGVRAADDAYQPPQSGADPYTPPRDGAYDQGVGRHLMRSRPTAGRRLPRGRQLPPLRRARHGIAPPQRPRARLRRALPSAERLRSGSARPGSAAALQFLFAERDHRCRPPLLRLGERRDSQASSNMPSRSPGAPTATSSARTRAALLSRVCATARAPSIRRMPASTKSTGRGPRSATTSAARAPRPWCSSTTCAIRCRSTNGMRACRARRLYRGWRRHRVPDPRQRHARAHTRWHRAQARCQRGVFKVYAGADVEPVLSRHRRVEEGRVERRAVDALRKIFASRIVGSRRRGLHETEGVGLRRISHSRARA